MADTTQINKLREKRQRKDLEESFYYPKQNLYSKKESELLDSIYSDEELLKKSTAKRDSNEIDDFWPQNNEHLMTSPTSKARFMTRAGWFSAGVAFSSIIWLIVFQINIHSIRTKTDTQIVFQESTNITTDKTIDKEITKELRKNNKLAEASKNGGFKFPIISGLFAKKPEPVIAKAAPDNVVQKANEILQEPETIEERVELAIQKEELKEEATAVKKNEPRFHTIRNGDSLWIIAMDYYGNASPDNIKKIMEANDMKNIGVLSPGKKLVIPF